MKEINIVSLQMVKTGTLSYLKNRISSPEDAAEIMQLFIGNSDREHLILICMNSKNAPPILIPTFNTAASIGRFLLSTKCQKFSIPS